MPRWPAGLPHFAYKTRRLTLPTPLCRGLASFYAIFIGGRNVEVPSLEGRSVAEALDEIQRLGLLS
ncbi:hypothetical protein, partial [Acetomicrobium sp. S15 = DSM 107314]|uniref:hypothetical protein n=1 Tax=Acetomicrobium sp. S15 = DSM 107314 TaxID=2529858 RepID=UPI00406D4CC5